MWHVVIWNHVHFSQLKTIHGFFWLISNAALEWDVCAEKDVCGEKDVGDTYKVWGDETNFLR